MRSTCVVVATRSPLRPGLLPSLVASMYCWLAWSRLKGLPMVSHAMGTRGYGHGGDKGVLNQSMINYVMGILKQTGQ